MNVRQAIESSGIERREARLLLAAAGGLSQASLLAHPERPLTQEARETYSAFLRRRLRGEPVAYIVGRKEFYGLDLEVTPAVLVPRPETELLVELALQRPFSAAVDLGTGSGAIALAIKRERSACRMVAVEASTPALEVARRNAERLGLDIELRQGSWCAPLDDERFDLLLSNPPYVAAGDRHLPELRFEPQAALLAGPDGLDAIRDIVGAAPRHLAPGGWLLLEHGEGQDGAVRRTLAQAGFESVRTWPDLGGIPRVTGGRR